MAEVPNLTGFTVAPQGSTNATVQAPVPQNSGGAQFEQLGKALSGAGSAASAIALDAQNQANELRVDDALNQVKERALTLTYDPSQGYTSLKGTDALNRPNGQSLQEEYGDQLRQSVDGQAANLSNDAQRIAFQKGAASIQQSFTAGVDQHYAQEFRTYTMSVDTGLIDTAQREIALNPTDPDTIAKANLRIDAAVARTSRLLGHSAEETENLSRQFKSQAYSMALSKMIGDNNLPLAQDFMAAHKGDMDASDIIKYDSLVTDGVRNQEVTGYVTSLFSPTGPAGAATPFDRMVAITAQSESGSRERDGNGNLITSSAGAQGKMQVMPATAAKPGYGITPAQDNSDAERSRVGRDLLGKFLQMYGDPAKAWAAYNWSKGGVDAAVKQYGANWQQHIPPETQKYVTGNMAALGAGASAGDPGAPRQSLSTLLEAARERYANDPRALQLAQGQITTMYNAQEADQSRNDEAAVNNAYGAMYKNAQANPGATTYLTPQIAQSVPGKYLPSLQNFSDSIKSSQTKNTVDPLLWAGLKTQIAEGRITNPGQLLQYAPRLSNSDFQSLTDDVIKVNQGDQKKIDSIATADRALKYVHGQMLEAGIDWTPDSKNPDGAKAYAQFTDQYYRQISTLERAGGKPLTDGEARDVALKLMAEIPNTGKGVFFGTNQRGYQLAHPALPLSAVPQNVQARVAAALRANGKPVTEHNIRWALANPDADLSTASGR